MSDTALNITPEAEQTIARMCERVAEVGRTYGRYSPQHVEMLESLQHALVGVMRLGGCIFQDSELSLYGSSFIEFGCIFHAKYLPGGKERDPLLGDWSIHS